MSFNIEEFMKWGFPVYREGWAESLKEKYYKYANGREDYGIWELSENLEKLHTHLQEIGKSFDMEEEVIAITRMAYPNHMDLDCEIASEAGLLHRLWDHKPDMDHSQFHAQLLKMMEESPVLWGTQVCYTSDKNTVPYFLKCIASYPQDELFQQSINENVKYDIKFDYVLKKEPFNQWVAVAKE